MKINRSRCLYHSSIPSKEVRERLLQFLNDTKMVESGGCEHGPPFFVTFNH